MKVAAYIRVSTEQQLENYSIPLQLERIKAFCFSRGWENVQEFIDGGYSGSNIQRPELQKLIQNINNFDIVIVYRLDRLSRSQKDTLYLIEEVLLPNNVEFISISETIDTSTPFGRAMIGILSVFAQLERETITERLKGGRYKLVKELGYWAGGTDANPTGYIRQEKGRLIINEEEATLVKRIFKEYLTLQSITKIQERFEKEGLPVWRFNRFVRILKNRLYIGEVSFSGEWFPGAHEPLVSKETFDRVQSLLERHKGKNFGKIKNMLLTKKIKCKQCGESYQSYITTDKLADGTKIKYRYYICRRRRFPKEFKTKCYNKTLNQRTVEDFVFNAIDNMNYETFIKKQKIKPINYDKLMLKIEEKIKKTLNLYLDDRLDSSILDEKIDELNKEKNKLELQKEKSLNNQNNEILELLKDKKFKTADMNDDEKLSLVHNLIKYVYVDNGVIEIVWQWDE